MFFIFLTVIFACLSISSVAQINRNGKAVYSIQTGAGIGRFNMKELQYGSSVLSGTELGGNLTLTRKSERNQQEVQFDYIKGRVSSPGDAQYKQDSRKISGLIGALWGLWDYGDRISLYGGVYTTLNSHRRKYESYVNFQSAGEDAIDLGPSVKLEAALLPAGSLVVNATLYTSIIATIRQQPFGGATGDKLEEQQFEFTTISGWKHFRFKSALVWNVSPATEVGLLYFSNWFKTGGDRIVNIFSNQLAVFCKFNLQRD